MQAQHIVRGLAHVGIVCDDAPRCAQFYIDHLGFEPDYDFTLTEGVRLVFVRCGGLIVEFAERGAKEIPGPVNHLALEVLGIDHLVAELRAAGVVFEKEEVFNNQPMFPLGTRNIFFTGPAGERVELYEYARGPQ